MSGGHILARVNQTEIRDVLDSLFTMTRASRVTLRRDVPDARGRGFPVTDELLAPGLESIKDEEYTDIMASPVAAEAAGGTQVTQKDSASCYPDDPEFHAMRAEYGGLGAQVVTPLFVDARLVGIVSVHHVGSPRDWTPDEIAACSRAAERIAPLIA